MASSSASTLRAPSPSPQFSETLNSHMFVTSVIPRVAINSKSPPSVSNSPFGQSIEQRCDSARVRKSLEELCQDIKELEDFITVSEDVIRRERERDREFYDRERRRKQQEISIRKFHNNNNNKENRSPPTCPIYSLQSPTYKRGYHLTLRKCKSANSGSAVSLTRLTTPKLRLSSTISTSGHEIRASRSGQDTQELIKSIIRMRNDSVSPANTEILPNHFVHSFLDDSVSPNTIGKKLDSNKNSLEMIVIDYAPDQPSVVCGSVVGDGDGIDLTQNPTPASASSNRSNAT